MALEINTTNKVTKVVEQEVQAAKIEVLAPIFDFRNTVGYLLTVTKDSSGNALTRNHYKITGTSYLTLISQQVAGGTLADIVLTSVASFVSTIETNNDIVEISDGEVLTAIAELLHT